MEYCHLTNCERSQIYALLSIGYSQVDIAKQLNRSPSTISRELRRNTGGRGYRPKQAQEKAEARRSLVSNTPKKMKGALLAIIEEKLHLDWSPEQISGFLAASSILISHESIYLHVWADKHQGGTLYSHLRHAGKKYNKRSSAKAGRGCIPNRVDIDQRPAIVERKERLGDWEGDTVIGANHQGAILTVVDRKSKLSIFVNLEGKTSEEVNKAIVGGFERLLDESPHINSLDQIARTITFDNGKEFSGHEDISELLGVACFFAKPYHSWERGLNEHTNGLLRQYYPKKTDFTNLSDEVTQWIEDRLNDRPRKVLNFMTPREVFMGKRRPAFIALGI